MNELTNIIANLVYSPTFNVYLVWIVAILYSVYYGYYFLSVNSFEDLSDTEFKNKYKFWFPSGKFSFGRFLALWPAFNCIAIGTLNDIVVIFLGGTYLEIYNKMWWSQFLDAATVFNFINSL
ncbi:MAG: hypothetical protein CMD50_05190 [Gammaproteobacteria bacterium]|nr:hypothetical protein [Gammaproteobacteria bacterium]|tara:strand:- start:19965 stop:20330 length:366 start_codon:yes stop_codon:yes gene_type:complete